MRKRKKFITRSVLVLILISSLLGTFTIFSSADSETDIPAGLIGGSAPQFVYYNRGDNPNGLKEALFPRYYIYDRDQIAFGLCGRNMVEQPWHILPFIRSQTTFKETLVQYNNLVRDTNYLSLANVYSRTDLLRSNIFQTWISYSTVGDSNYSFAIEFRVRNISSWTYDWLPIYVVYVEFIDNQGNVLEENVMPGLSETSVDKGTNPVVSNGILKITSNSTETYTYYDVGQLMAQGLSHGAKGVQFRFEEYFYNKNGGYPTGNLGDSTYFQNLYTPNAQNLPLTSFPINFYFKTAEDIADEEFKRGVKLGEKIGYENGYTNGKSDGVEEGARYNAVDGLIALAQVPGALISSMLSFDFFGVNLANAVKALIMLAVVAFIVIIFLKFII